MPGGLIQAMQSLAPIVMAVMVLIALALLWRRDKSVWLIVAMIAEVAGLLFRGVLFVAPGLAQSTPLFFTVWTLSSLVFAAGLLGYAVETTQRR
jgi:uncharacterized membrane protein YGL010W